MSVREPWVAALPEWDWDDVWNGPWTVGSEPRREGQTAIKSGAFTILTVGDYFDGGGPIEERLSFVCALFNAYHDSAPAESARVDELEKALRDVRAVFPQGVCSECQGFEFEVSEANRIIDDALPPAASDRTQNA